jgi:hypothetical protein
MPSPVPSWFGFERSWIARALKALREDPTTLRKDRIEHAQRLLGLGNQQVFALEHWLRALGLIIRDRSGYLLSPRALLISDRDPQVEEAGTWFAIHYWLASSREYAFSYWCAANCLPRRFTRANLLGVLARELPGKKDATYANYLKAFLSLLKSTPLGNELGLFRVDEEEVSSEEFDALTIPSAVVSYVLCDWREKHGRSTVAIDELEQPEAPGKMFRIRRDALDKHLDRIAERYSKRVLWVSRTAGLNSVTFSNGIASLALLRAYYLEQTEGLDPLKALTLACEAEQLCEGGQQ